VILAGDIGGTKCNLALYEPAPEGFRKIVHEHYESREFATFHQLIDKFLSDAQAQTGKTEVGRIEAAGFGVAGPVIDFRVKATNLPWIIDGPALEKQLSTKHIALLNDLEATGYGVALLQPSEISTLNRGTPAPQSTQAVIAAGTGLGEAFLFWTGNRYVVGGTEGGHTDFAPRNELEIELLRHMKKQDQFVSVELILSGRGFRTIHEFLNPAVRHPSFEGPEADAAPEITRLAVAGQCPVCVQTLDLWMSIYGAEAGNFALKVLARGGVWVAGGIAAKLRQKVEDGTFFRAFCEKEKFGALMAQIPIYLVLNEEAPLLGALSQASERMKLGKSRIPGV
jgi:glucokinase